MQQGAPTEIYADPKTKFVAEFIGRSNWFSGRFDGPASDGLRRFEAAVGVAFLVQAPDGADVGPDGYEVCVRPERIYAGQGTPTAEGPVNELSGVIRDMAHLGSDVHLLVELDGGYRLTVIEQYLGQRLEEAGQRIELRFRPQDCIVVPAES